jgi:hypothetical protein
VVAADDVMGENSDQVGEEVPSSIPELQMGSTDIRLHLIGDGKHTSKSSCPMIVKPGAKEARRCEECLCQSNQQMAEPVIG